MASVRIAMIVLVSTTMAACFAGCSRGEPTMEISPFAMRWAGDGEALWACQIAISTDGKRVAAVGGLLHVTVFDTNTQTAVWSRRLDYGYPDFVTFARYNHAAAGDNTSRAGTSENAIVAVWSDIEYRTPGEYGRPMLKPLMPDGTTLVRWLDADDGHELDAFKLPRGEQAIGSSPDGRELMVSRDHTLYRYDLASKKPIGSPIERGEQLFFSSSKDRYAIATKCTDDETGVEANASDSDEEAGRDYDVVIREWSGTEIGRARLRLLRWTIGLDDKAIYTRDKNGNVLAAALDGKTPPRYVTRGSLAFTLLPGGGRFAVLHRNGTLAIGDLETGERLQWCRLPISTRNRGWELAAGCDGTIAVTSHPIDTWPVYDMFFGCAKVLSSTERHEERTSSF